MKNWHCIGKTTMSGHPAATEEKQSTFRRQNGSIYGLPATDQDKKDYVRLHLDDIEYRTIPFSTENEAIEFEKYVRERERYEFPEKNSAKNK